MSAGYRIADEPVAGGMAHLAVRPLWPLLAVMFAGTWLSWPWFVVNGHAVGSPTRTRELVLAVLGFVGSAVIVLIIASLHGSGVLGDRAMPYAFLALILWKLGMSYWLYILQSRTFELYEYYGGSVRNGLLLVIAGAFLTPRLLGALAEIPLLAVVLR